MVVLSLMQFVPLLYVRATISYLLIGCCLDKLIDTLIIKYQYGFGIMVFNGTFNNISAISWLSVLLVEENGVSGENHRLAASH